jgi:hypothetical protein
MILPVGGFWCRSRAPAVLQRLEGRLNLVLHREEDEHTLPGSGCVMRIYNVVTTAVST